MTQLTYADEHGCPTATGAYVMMGVIALIAMLAAEVEPEALSHLFYGIVVLLVIGLIVVGSRRRIPVEAETSESELATL